MKKLVIIGANDFQNQLIQKANELGYETHVFAWEEGAVGKESADFFYPISIVEKGTILEICRNIRPDGICSIASDLASITVNYVAEHLGLPCNRTQYSTIQTNKYEMRKALLAAGIPCPRFYATISDPDLQKLSNFTLPVIVKPTDRSGSRSITKLENLAGLSNAVIRACDVSFEKKAIIEEYLDGDEYSMETISFRGVHHFLAVTKKFTTGAPGFIETGHRQPSGLSDTMVKKAISTVFKALDALHIENSAGHSEFKVDREGNIRIIEIGARMGGDCIGSDLVYLSTGHDFMKMVIDVACGNAPQFAPQPRSNAVEIRFLFTQEDVDTLERLKATSPDRIYRISPLEMENIGKTIDSSSRVGYYILLSNTHIGDTV